MRIEPYGVGSVLHVVKRGARDKEIIRDEGDCWHFARNLFILNDHFQPPSRSDMYKSDLYTHGNDIFHRPKEWPARNPLVSILGWSLLDNHFHLLLQEVAEGGVSKFMQRICGSMTLSFNEKYEEIGSIFQGAFKSRTVSTDKYLQYVHSYIIVKNTFEKYPGGLKKAIEEFDKAWQWAGEYPFSSFLTASAGTQSPIIDMRAFYDMGLSRKDFRSYAKDMLITHMKIKEDFADICIEEW